MCALSASVTAEQAPAKGPTDDSASALTEQKALLHKMAMEKQQASKAVLTNTIHAAPTPQHVSASPELHKAEEQAKAQAEPTSHEVETTNADGWKGKHEGHVDHDPAMAVTADGSAQGGNKGGTYGVLKNLGDNLGLTNSVLAAGKGDVKTDAKPVGEAVQQWVKAKDPKAAWGNAITIVSLIGGTVVTITAVGTYFVAKAENKKLKKAKKRSNLLGGRYGSVKKEADSSDDEAPQYEPMMMTDIV